METNNAVPAENLSLEEMLDGVAEAMRVPMPIGHLCGMVVYLNQWDGLLLIGDQAVPVDHPLIAGTAIHKAVLDAMGVV